MNLESQTFVIDNHQPTLPREGEGAGEDTARNEPWKLTQVERQHRTIKTLQEMVEQQRKDMNKLKAKAERLLIEARKQRDDLRAELAKRDATIAELREIEKQFEAALLAMTTERDAYASTALAGLSAFGCTPMEGYVKDGGVSLLAADFKRARERFKEAKARAASKEHDLCSTITSLRAQLARGAAIEEAAREFHGKFIEANLYFEDTKAAWHRLKEVLASPGPRGTPEGEREAIGDAFGEDASEEEEAFVKALPTAARLAILERVAREAKAYLNHNRRINRFEREQALHLALAELDATEVKP